MGRDVTGIRGELNKSPYAKVRATISADSDGEANKEVNDCVVKECTSEAPVPENITDKQEVLTIKNTNNLAMKSAETEDQKSSSPEKPLSEEIPAEKSEIKNTPQKPSSLTVDKQAVVETPDSQTVKGSKSPNSSKKLLPSTPNVTRKLLDDDDNWSMTSSASVRTTRSRTTVPVAPTFTISERLQKRKEYYAKLEEKRKALEAEKRDFEERTKEEEEAAIKQMRKNMKFKANPVPNFYYDKSSPKKELKKLPTTRAISPSFGRRKSFSDAIKFPSEEKTSGRAYRHSLSGHLPTSSPKTNRLRQPKETT